jgi:hypothetical protein
MIVKFDYPERISRLLLPPELSQTLATLTPILIGSRNGNVQVQEQGIDI